VRRDWLKDLRDAPWPSRGLPIFRAPAPALFAGLMRQYLLVSLFRAIAESLASEHASRLAAMEAAQSNIEEHLEELQSDYRRERQSAITEELMDIVSGYVSVGAADNAE
jgi:F-type H+-transporting ATPase subunit gamma